jgi:GxxExxY protein
VPAFIHAELSESVIRCAFEVRRQLRPGLAEVLYRRALVLELEAQRLPVKTEVPYAVWYRGGAIGTYRADVVVDDRLIVEVKHVDRLVQAHRDQLHNYLRIAELRVGLLVNFGVRSEVRRVENWQFDDSVPLARFALPED